MCTKQFHVHGQGRSGVPDRKLFPKFWKTLGYVDFCVTASVVFPEECLGRAMV